MFGGTPTNLSLPFLSERVEIVTGVNLPMLIKASALREGEPGGGGARGARAGQGLDLRRERDPGAEGRVIRRELRIRNRLGLHARAAARFVHTAGRFQRRVTAGREGRVMDGKSILGILLLAASQGTSVEVTVEGPDEEQAMAALVALVESGFGEDA